MNVGSSSEIQSVLLTTSVWRQKRVVTFNTALILISSVVLFLYVQRIICTFTKGKTFDALYIEKEYSKINIRDNSHAT